MLTGAHLALGARTAQLCSQQLISLNLVLGRREEKEGIKGETKVGEQKAQALGGQSRQLGHVAATSLAIAGADNAFCDSCLLAAAH